MWQKLLNEWIEVDRWSHRRTKRNRKVRDGLRRDRRRRLGLFVIWREDILGFVPGEAPQKRVCVGGINGVFGLADALADGFEGGARAANEAGFKIVEVPLNSPEPMRSIALLSEAFGDRALVGAGTVLTTAQVNEVAAAGGKLIVMPHGDVAVIAEAKRLGLY